MSMDNEGSPNSALEQELAQRFSRLRDHDREQAPPFPTEHELLSGASARVRPVLARSLTAAVVVFAGATLFALRPAPDPADLYLAIMRENIVTTDHLLRATPGVLPETGLLPVLYELNFSDDSTE